MSIQADEYKVVSAYEDGAIAVWDRQSAFIWFELKGRSNKISTLQFDATRLIADGTYSLIVVHDFDIPFGSLDQNGFQYEAGTDAEDEEVEDVGQGGDNDEDDDDGGRPSSTS